MSNNCSGIQARIARQNANRELNRKFQRHMVVHQEYCDYQALQDTINTSGTWEELLDTYKKLEDPTRMVRNPEYKG